MMCTNLTRIFFLLCLPLLFSCSFNKTFLHPGKPAGDRMMLHTGKDSILLTYTGPDRKPTLFKNGTEPFLPHIEIENVYFDNGRGHKLNGWMLSPKNKQAGATILHLHGNAGSVPGYFLLMAKLVAQGFRIFLFDYSGFGYSEGQATRGNVKRDALAALGYIKTRKDVQGKPLVLYGQSLGGHLAPVIAAARPQDVDALVVEGAFSSHHDIAAIKGGIMGRILVREMYSGKRSIARFNKPVLIIHSTEDRTIPISMGRELYRRAGEPKQFYEIRHRHITGPVHYSDSIAYKIWSMLR